MEKKSGKYLNIYSKGILGLFLLIGLLFSDKTVWQRDASVDFSSAARVTSALVSVNGGRPQRMELPTQLHDLPYHSLVRLEFDTAPEMSDYLFLHTVYSKATVLVDGVEIYTFGKEGTYPSFFMDPPSTGFSVPLVHGIGGSLRPGESCHVCVEFESPAARHTLVLYEPIVGMEEGIFSILYSEYGIIMVIALLYIGIGAIVAALSLFFLKSDLKGRRLLWPGLLCLASGVWEFSENTLIVYIFQKPSLLYMLAFIAMFSIPLPLLFYARITLNMRDSKIIRMTVIILEVSILAAMTLQLTGLVPFSKSMYPFHVILFASIYVVFCMSVYKLVKDPEPHASMFMVACSVLAIAVTVEVVNYYTHFSGRFSMFFQAGMLLFNLINGILAAIQMNKTFRMSIKAIRLEEEMKFLEKSVTAQAQKNKMLQEHEEEIRRQRHDLRHQYSYMKELLEDQSYEQLEEYMDAAMKSIPVDRSVNYCENTVANATIGYYVAVARKNGIGVDIRAQIPDESQMKELSESSLCVILGNLLENAIEACGRIPDTQENRNASSGARFIRFRTRVQGQMLFIVMDNSCDIATIHAADGGVFYSSKRAEVGIGLDSIQSITGKNGGSARFGLKDGIFRSEVYVRM